MAIPWRQCCVRLVGALHELHADEEHAHEQGQRLVLRRHHLADGRVVVADGEADVPRARRRPAASTSASARAAVQLLVQRAHGHGRVSDGRLIEGELWHQLVPEVRVGRARQHGAHHLAEELERPALGLAPVAGRRQHAGPVRLQRRRRLGRRGRVAIALAAGAGTPPAERLRIVAFDLADSLRERDESRRSACQPSGAHETIGAGCRPHTDLHV